MSSHSNGTGGTATPRAPDARVRAMLEAPIAYPGPHELAQYADDAGPVVDRADRDRSGGLGTDVLAGVAVVVPVLMLMQNMSQGAMGGGISSAVARALGAGDSGSSRSWRAMRWPSIC